MTEIKELYRVCKRCSRSLPATSQYFFHNKRAKGGLDYWCRDCHYKEHARWRARHPERLRVHRHKFVHSQKGKEYTREYTKTWRHSKPDIYRPKLITFTEKRQELRNIVLTHYSHGVPKCERCGESGCWFLALDHIHNDGKAERERLGVGFRFFSTIIKRGFPPNYQVLCHNCHWLKHVSERPPQLSVYIRRWKEEVFTGYGSMCACCGIDNRELLTLDHVCRKPDQPRTRGYAHYRDAIRRQFPSDYQVLCWNCNMGKRTGAVCPHVLTKVA